MANNLNVHGKETDVGGADYAAKWETEEVSPGVHRPVQKVGELDVAGAAVSASNRLPTSATDAGANWTSVYGVAGAVFSSANASGADAAITDFPVSGQKIVIDDLFISVDTQMEVMIKSDSGGVILFDGFLPAYPGFQQVTPRGKLKLPVVDKKAHVRTDVSGKVRILAFYHSES